MRYPRRNLIHLGDAGRGRLRCGAVPKGEGLGFPNWSFTPEKVTCKKCLKSYEKKVKGSRS